MVEIFFIILSILLIPSVYTLIIFGQRKSFLLLKSKYKGFFSFLSSTLIIPYKGEVFSLLRISNGRYSCLQILLEVPPHNKIVIGHNQSKRFFKVSFWKIRPKMYQSYLHFGIKDEIAADLLQNNMRIFEKEFQHLTIDWEIHFKPTPTKITVLRYIGLSDEVLLAHDDRLREVFDEILTIRNGIFYTVNKS